MIRRKNVALAAAVAGMFALATAPAFSASAADDKVKCEGVNGCKGKSECKTATNECHGQNGCKGKGYLMLTQAECDAAKAKLKEGLK